MQPPAQLVCPCAQLTLQAPLEHTSSAAHTRPQAPQLAWAELKVTQTPEQLVVPAGHATEHAPPTHTPPLGHTCPQAPQL
jgi:hypothetical protein